MILNEITDKYHYHNISDIIHQYNGEVRLSELKKYVMKHSYFKEFGFEPTLIAYQIYLQSL